MPTIDDEQRRGEEVRQALREAVEELSTTERRQVDDIVKALTDRALDGIKTPVRCDRHTFRPLHKDRENAILYCQGCGLIRVLELAVTEDGRVPVLDIPTPTAMPEDWPKVGVGDAQKMERIHAIRHLHGLVKAFEEEFGGQDLLLEVKEFLENLEE